MKLLDKLKNALFEEEYVEVEEPKPVKKKEKPIAKKIIVEDKPKKQAPKEDLIVEEEKKEEKVETPNRDFKFKAILDDDFIDLEEDKKQKPLPKIEPKKEEKPKPVKKEVKETRPLYQGEKKQEDKNLYSGSSKINNNTDNEIKIHEYGSASRQHEKKTFHPSPIISPIYGVLDENYKKDDIVTKKEVRITSSYKSKNIDVDSVREKAYGNSDDIFEEELTSNKQKEPTKEETEDFAIKEEDSLLDISDDNTPSVAKVTMGDAEEYYSDLGLEYNIDYKDVSHEKATGRRTDLKNFDEEETKNDDASIEDNLFDLIDSMYEEKKGE